MKYHQLSEPVSHSQMPLLLKQIPGSEQCARLDGRNHIEALHLLAIGTAARDNSRRQEAYSFPISEVGNDWMAADHLLS